MKLQKLAGSTSEIWQVFVPDSSSTTGAGLTGLVFNSGSLTAYYHRDTDTTATAITLVTMTVGTFTSSGFKEIDATNLPGWYQFCPPNAAIASGAKSCVFHLKGAANMAPLPIEVQLTAVNPDSATAFVTSAVAASVTAGVTVTTNNDKTGYTLSAAGVQAVWDALTSALTTVGSIGKLIVTNLDALISSRMATFTQPTGFLAATFPTTVASTTNITAGTITTTTNVTNAPTAGDLTATMKASVTTAASAATPAVTVSDKTGFSLSTAGILAIWHQLTAAVVTASTMGKLLLDTLDAAISTRTKPADTQAAVTLVTTTTNLTNAPTAGDLTATMKASVTTAATAATPVAASVTAGVTLASTLVTLSAAERNSIADALLVRHQQGGSAGGSGTKVSDALAGGLMSLTISGGTLTVKNGDGTTAYTRTLTRSALDAIVSAA